MEVVLELFEQAQIAGSDGQRLPLPQKAITDSGKPVQDAVELRRSQFCSRAFYQQIAGDQPERIEHFDVDPDGSVLVPRFGTLTGRPSRRSFDALDRF